MSVIQRLLGREDRFFTLLESSASEAKAATSYLDRVVALLGERPVDEAMGDLAQCRRKHKRVTQEISEQLCEKFVTPLDREDIAALASALYKISKNVEKIGDRLTIAPLGAKMETIVRQISMLDQGAAIVEKMVRELHTREHDVLRDDYERLQVIEGEADRVMTELLSGSYRSETDARMVVFWKDIYELLEKGVDRCRDAGAIIFEIVLKNA